MSKRTYYYYIDESGHVNNDQAVFLYGCIRTDTPGFSTTAVEKLKEELKDDIWFFEFEEQIKKGFHACENHFDLRTAFYRILPLLNFRAFFEVIYKESQFFADLKVENKDYEIIAKMLKNLINRMVLKEREAKHIFYFEELEVQSKSLKNILAEIFTSYENIDIEYYIVGKGDDNLSIVDYINYSLFNIFVESDEKKFRKNTTTIKMFDVLKEKIGLVHIWNNNTFFSRKGKSEELIEIDNLRKVMAEA